MGVLKVKAISLPYIFQVMYVLCFTRPSYQVSVYRTIDHLVDYLSHSNAHEEFCQEAWWFLLYCFMTNSYITHHTRIDLCPNTQFFSTQQRAYQSFSNRFLV